jgi:hypothetical protein
MNIALPAALWQFERLALVVSETRCVLVSWKKGSFTKLGEFVNDTQGIQEFSHFLKREASKFKGQTINVMVSVVGEDYRFEKVAHLVGKYRTDMLKRRFQQLFRGTTYHIAVPQGRESIGRRQDLVLFCGILSNEKIQPWVRELTRIGMNLAGVHLSSLITGLIYKHIVSSDAEGMQVVSMCVEDNSIRHSFFVDGKLRFSRMSRLRDNSTAEDVFRSVRNEIEKTVQYLTSIRIVQGNTKISAHVVCADDIYEEIYNFCTQAEGGRVSYFADSGRELCVKLGIKKAIDSYGRDSTPVVNEMLRLVFFNQLAPLEQIRYYIAKMTAIIACVALGVWGSFNILNDGISYLGTYGRYTSENGDLQQEIAGLSSNYDELVSGFVSPPSTIENMRASVNFLNVVNRSNFNPGKMMLFVSKLLQVAPALEIDALNWYLTADSEGGPGSFSFVSSDTVFEVLEIRGKLTSNIRPELAFEQYSNFADAVNSRIDMQFIVSVEPSLVQADGELSGSVDRRTDVRSQLNAYTNDEFTAKIVWDPSYLDNLNETTN